MYVYEKFAEQGLFSTMQSKGLLPVEFDDLSGEQMDLLYNNLHGVRQLARIGRDLSVDDLADLIGNMYYKKWTENLEYYALKADLLKGDKETVTENIVDDNEMVDERTSTNSVSAYNDDDFVNNDKDDSTNTINTDNKRDRTLTRRMMRVSDAKSLQELLQNNFLCDIIFVDVNTVLTLKIFAGKTDLSTYEWYYQ